MLTKGPLLNRWRAPTLVDEAAFWIHLAPQWREAGLDSLAHEVQSVDFSALENGAVRLVAATVVHGHEAALAAVTYTYVVYGSGDVLLTVALRPTEHLREAVASLPRVGVALEVPTRMDRVQTRWAALTGPSGVGLLLAADSVFVLGTNRFENVAEPRTWMRFARPGR